MVKQPSYKNLCLLEIQIWDSKWRILKDTDPISVVKLIKCIIFWKFYTVGWNFEYRTNKLVSDHSHRKPIMPHSDMFVNIWGTFIAFEAIGTLESGLTTTIVFHVSLEGLLIGVTSIASWTMISHLWPLKNGLTISLFFCSFPQICVRP